MNVQAYSRLECTVPSRLALRETSSAITAQFGLEVQLHSRDERPGQAWPCPIWPTCDDIGVVGEVLYSAKHF